MYKPSMRDILARIPVMPIMTIQDASRAGDLARALVDGGITAFEVVLRTPASLQAIEAMAAAAPEAAVGAGTLLNAQQVRQALDAGAAFGVSPGLTPALGAAVRDAKLPFLPGVATAGEVMQALEYGFTELKYFPAQGEQGVAWLKSLADVFPQVAFCPTGGIRPPHIPAYLALPNCKTVGGSWMVPADLLESKDWPAITALARQAAAMRGA